jgi:hypothetical protein
MEEQAQFKREIAARRRVRNMLDRQLGLLGNIRTRIEPWCGEARSRVASVFDRQMKKLPKDIDRLTAEIGRIDVQLRAAQFAYLVLTVMAKKGGLSFYAGVVRAILRNPESPREELRSFGHLIDGNVRHEELKFAMIGDRQTNDIEPPSRLLGPGHMVTVRLLSGSYAEKEPPQAKYEFPPTFLADTLAQAKALLLCKNTWDSIRCIGDPPAFNWDVDFGNPGFFPRSPAGTAKGGEIADLRIGIDHILYGIAYTKDAQSITSRVCAGVLAEHLSRSDSGYEKTLNRCDRLPVEGGPESPLPVRRARVLSRLIEAGFHPPQGDSGRMRQQIEELRRVLENRTPRPDDVLREIERALESLHRGP